MTYCNPIPAFSDFTTFHLGPGFWATVPADKTADLLHHHLCCAWQTITDYRLPIPASQHRLELVVMLGVEAELLFFNAAIFEPCQEERDLFSPISFVVPFSLFRPTCNSWAGNHPARSLI
jgi:hypothetical protein